MNMTRFLKFLKATSVPINKSHTIYLLVIFAIVLSCDQFIKYIFSTYLRNLHTPSLLGFSLEPFLNYHWGFGFELGIKPLLSFIIIAAFLCIITYIYIFFIHYSSFLKSLNLYLTILLAGIVSNLIERIQKGYVFDPISYKWGSYINTHFNSSDILQTFAWVLIICIIILNRKKIWISKEKRKTLLVMKKYQLEFIFYLVITVLWISIFFSLINYQFLNYFQNAEIKNENFLLFKYFSSYSLIVLVTLIVPITGTAVYFSNKIYGPIYAFNRYIKNLLDGKNPEDLKLRDNDQLKKEFEKLSLEIKNKINKS